MGVRGPVTLARAFPAAVGREEACLSSGFKPEMRGAEGCPVKVLPEGDTTLTREEARMERRKEAGLGQFTIVGKAETPLLKVPLYQVLIPSFYLRIL